MEGAVADELRLSSPDPRPPTSEQPWTYRSDQICCELLRIGTDMLEAVLLQRMEGMDDFCHRSRRRGWWPARELSARRDLTCPLSNSTRASIKRRLHSCIN